MVCEMQSRGSPEPLHAIAHPPAGALARRKPCLIEVARHGRRRWALLVRRGALTRRPAARVLPQNSDALRYCTPRLGRPRLVYSLDAVENLAQIALSDLNIVVGLQIQPKLRRRAKRLGEPKRGIGRN